MCKLYNNIFYVYIKYQKIFIYFREYEDSINLMCHIYEPNLNIGQHSIKSKTWDLLLNVRFYDICDLGTYTLNHKYQMVG